MGVPPLALHTTRRLLLAKQLLSETDLPATQIALASGFGSVRRFNAAFQQGCGLAPTQIRRARRQATGDGLTLRLCYRPPFDFAAMLAFLGKRAMPGLRSEEHTSELQSLMRLSYAVFCLKTKKTNTKHKIKKTKSYNKKKISKLNNTIIQNIRKIIKNKSQCRSILLITTQTS